VGHVSPSKTEKGAAVRKCSVSWTPTHKIKW
jgi:hypothetical protein